MSVVSIISINLPNQKWIRKRDNKLIKFHNKTKDSIW